MTFNIRCGSARDGIHGWPYRNNRTIAKIRARAPDILGLQEAEVHQITDLSATLPEYRWVGVGRDDGANQGEFCPIFVRESRFRVLDSGTFWFSDTPTVPGSRSWGNRCVRIATWARLLELQDSRSLISVNLHIDHEHQGSRVRSIGYLADWIREAGETSAIILGDFNAGEPNPCLLPLRQAGFRDTYREIHPDAADVGTFHGFSDTYEADKIDYIWVSSDWRVDDAEIDRSEAPGGYASDHAAVTARIRALDHE